MRLDGLVATTATATTTIAAAQRLGDCGLVATTTAAATTTIAAAQRRLGGYEHGNGYDHDRCGGYDHDRCGSTTAAITTLAMVTIAAAMATIAEPMSVLDRPPLPPPRTLLTGGVY